MALDTYANLKAALRDRSHREDMTDDRLDDFIDLAEADIWNRLRVSYMDVRATATTSTTDRFLALPDGFIKMRRLTVQSGSSHYEIDYRAPEAMKLQTTSGRPRFFTTSSQLGFDRTANSAYTLEMQYWKRLTAISDSNTSNAILTNFPQIYFYGALMHLFDFTDEVNKEAKFRALFDQEIKDANKQNRKDRIGPAPAMSTPGSTP